MLEECQHIFCIVVILGSFCCHVKVSALCENLCNFSVNCLYLGFVTRFCNPFVHHFCSFSLFTYSNFVSFVNQYFNVLILHTLMESHLIISKPRRDDKINILCANRCILEIDDKPRSKPVEDNFVEVRFFGFPISFHSRRKILPFVVRNEESTWIIVGVIWPSLLCVHYNVWLREPRTVLVVLNDLLHH